MQEQPVLLEEDGFEDEILVEEETTVVNAMWGDIGGNIENQTDLQNALDAKQDSLTEAQLNAVNSGITSEKVTTYDGYADQIASKADQSALNTEATTREQADTALGRRIDDEATARQNADNGLQTQIDAITSKSDVVDVVANYAALQAYDTSSLSDNDVIKVLDDETHEDALTYYRWSTATQTWTYIGQEAPYYSKGQMDVMLQGKQNKLTAGTNIQIQNGTISATDTTYTAGNGLNLNGTEFSADTDILATKENLESYYTKPETDNLLLPKLEAEVVAELPTTGTEGKLYLTPKAHTTQTATGNPITATVAEDAGALESFQLDGDTFQQGYTGKNLVKPVATSTITASYDETTGEYSVSKATSATWPWLTGFCTLSQTITSGTTITISRNVGSSFNFWVRTYHPDNTYGSYNFGNIILSQTITEEKDIDRIVIMANAIPDNFSYSFKLQVELGNEATSFEPYVGGQPSPNPDYPQPIQTVTGEQTVSINGTDYPINLGKNLFDKDNIVQGIPQPSDGSIGQTTSNGRTCQFIPVMPNTQYTHSGHPSGWAVIAYYRADKSFISRVGDVATITTPSDCFYVSVSCSVNNLDTCQFEAGSTATTYAPYKTPIELCKLGDYQDYIWKDGEDWKVHKATGSYTFDGSETWQWDSARIPRLYLASGELGRLGITARIPEATSDMPIGLTTKFTPKTFASFYSNSEGDGFAMSTTGQNFQVGSNAWGDDSTKAKSDIVGLKWLYALATGYTTDTTITDQELIAQLEAIRTASLENGANTITNTATGSNLAGDMEIGYYGYNPTNRYDKWLWLDINNEYEQIGE